MSVFAVFEATMIRLEVRVNCSGNSVGAFVCQRCSHVPPQCVARLASAAELQLLVGGLIEVEPGQSRNREPFVRNG
jgi:hypothetical protein